MAKKDNDLSDALKLKIVLHPFKEFSGKFMIKNNFGAYCGNIGMFVLFKDYFSFTCPKVFRSKYIAEKFIAQEMR